MKKNKISKNWIRKQNKDPFFKQAKIEGYRSRSAYKLIEINNKFSFIKKNSLLLDLGSSPGGWSQAANKIIKRGKILSVDIKKMEKINNVIFLHEDLNDSEIYNKIYSYFNKKIDVVISDIAANTSGNKNLDSFKTGELCMASMNLAIQILKENGVFLSKFFMGSIFSEINKKAKTHFEQVVNFKPKSSKKESREIYLFCKNILKN